MRRQGATSKLAGALPERARGLSYADLASEAAPPMVLEEEWEYMNRGI